MTKQTRRGSDADQVARIIKELDRRITAVERRRDVGDVENVLEKENGFLVETNVTVEVYDSEDDIESDEPVSVSESHNEATDYADFWLANALTGTSLPQPSEIIIGDSDSNEPLTKIGSSTIVEAYESNRDAVFVGQLDSTELNGHTLREIAVTNGSDRFNHAPIDPPIEKTSQKQLNLKVRFVFLHA